MDTLSLRLFILAAEKLNISAAGRALGMAPAVASTRIAKLEYQLGADLLHRSTRQVALSSEGQDFLPYAREIIAQAETALAVLGKGEAKTAGSLRFAAPSTFAHQYIVPLLPLFLETYPDVILDLHFSDAQFDLIEGSYDLALRNTVLEDSSLTARKLADDSRILCASPAYLDKRGPLQQPGDLLDHQLIAFRDIKPRSLVSSAGQEVIFDPKKAAHYLVVNDGLALKQMTVNGAGVSINSLWSVHEELKAGKLLQVLPDFMMAESPALWLIYPKSNVVSAKVRLFMDFLLKHIGRSAVWNQPDARK